MERLICKACGGRSLKSTEVTFEEPGTEAADAVAVPDARFYSCPVCGDNWLSLTAIARGGRQRLTLVHQMDRTPVLKRTTLLSVRGRVVREAAWAYFLDDQEVEAADWHARLTRRRVLLRSRCSN